jgi:hypothetical protein
MLVGDHFKDIYDVCVVVTAAMVMLLRDFGPNVIFLLFMFTA